MLEKYCGILLLMIVTWVSVFTLVMVGYIKAIFTLAYNVAGFSLPSSFPLNIIVCQIILCDL